VKPLARQRAAGILGGGGGGGGGAGAARFGLRGQPAPEAAVRRAARRPEAAVG
jgi:hypothetical protein